MKLCALFSFNRLNRANFPQILTKNDEYFLDNLFQDVLADIFFTQAMNELCYYADHYCMDNRLPVPVRFILDDFATNCHIAEFPRMIASIRSREISAMLMIQSEAQLEKGYGHDAKTIISNCDTYVYMGGNDIETARAVSERCDFLAIQMVIFCYNILYESYNYL